MTEVSTERPAEPFPDHALTEAPTERVQTPLGERPARSIFRCPECGSFFDAPRRNPETGNLARKCISCNEWYPVATLRWEAATELPHPRLSRSLTRLGPALQA
jgi:hypothetical protein